MHSVGSSSPHTNLIARWKVTDSAYRQRGGHIRVKICTDSAYMQRGGHIRVRICTDSAYIQRGGTSGLKYLQTWPTGRERGNIRVKNVHADI